mgnify:FL=1|tara:strand:- start:36 stop:554 length:519 start_codon:yes stop_codon:yes gene_type:complete
MPNLNGQEKNLELENSELIEEFSINLDLTKKQILRKQVLQLLYLLDINKGIVEIQKKSFLNIFESNGLSDEEEKEAENLSIEIFSHKLELDEMIQSFAEEYPVNQLSIVDKSLLRLAFWEVKKLRKSDNFPKLVEDFENLGYLFGSDNSNKFIKGVLKSLIKKIDNIYYKTK